MNWAYHVSVFGLLTFLLWRVLEIDDHLHGEGHEPHSVFMVLYLVILLWAGYGSLLYGILKDKK